MPSNFFQRANSNNTVRCTISGAQGTSVIDFDTNGGGAPLDWKFTPTGGSQIQLTEATLGAGFQAVIGQGQDVTQAGANGVTIFPIARIGVDTGAALAYKNYYAREVLGGFPDPTPGANQDIYIVEGFFPDFWESLESRDDSIPTVLRSGNITMQTQWVAGYSTGHDTSTPPVNQPATWIRTYNGSSPDMPWDINTFAEPVYFAAKDWNGNSVATNSGIFMEGNEHIAAASDNSNWNVRLREIPEGRVAFRVKISLKYASNDAWAGVIFRKSVPSGANMTMDDAYFASGYMLRVYRATGYIELWDADGTGNDTLLNTWTSGAANIQPVVSGNDYGVRLELRTVNYDSSKLQLWYNDGTNGDICLTPDGSGNPDFYTLTGTVYTGPHIGLIAYTTMSNPRLPSPQPNFVRFGDREIMNVGTNTRITYAPNSSEQSLHVTIEHGPAPGITTPPPNILYTAGQQAFLKFGDSQFDYAIITHYLSTVRGPTASSELQYDCGYASADIAFAGDNSGNPPSSPSGFGLATIMSGLSFTNPPSPYTVEPHYTCAPYLANPGFGYLHTNALKYYSSVTSIPGWDIESVTITTKWFPFYP